MSARVSSGKDSKQDYGSPWPFIRQLKNHFNITFDLAAHQGNHKCDRWFGPGGIAENALIENWSEKIKQASGEWGYLNPEYNDIDPWYFKCATESKHGFRAVSLVPMDTAGWFDHIPGHAGIWHLKGRIKFDGAKESGSKDSALHSWHPDYVGQFKVWDWKKDQFLI